VTQEIDELKKGKTRYTNKKIKKLDIDVSEEMRINFILVFTLLITAKNIEEFDEILINIYNVYCFQNAETFVFESINYLKEKCLNRELDKSKNSLNFDKSDPGEKNRHNTVILEEKQEKVNNFFFIYAHKINPFMFIIDCRKFAMDQIL
jgi:hypothetical protein